jgi:hypothetical protein
MPLGTTDLHTGPVLFARQFIKDLRWTGCHLSVSITHLPSSVNSNLHGSIPINTTEVDHMCDPSANCRILDSFLQRYT